MSDNRAAGQANAAADLGYVEGQAQKARPGWLIRFVRHVVNPKTIAAAVGALVMFGLGACVTFLVQSHTAREAKAKEAREELRVILKDVPEASQGIAERRRRAERWLVLYSDGPAAEAINDVIAYLDNAAAKAKELEAADAEVKAAEARAIAAREAEERARDAQAKAEAEQRRKAEERAKREADAKAARLRAAEEQRRKAALEALMAIRAFDRAPK